MPKRHHRNQHGDWTLMLRADVRDAEVARIRKDHPDVAGALDKMARRFKEWDEHGWTVFCGWLEHAYQKTAKYWSDDIAGVSEQAIWEAVFPTRRSRSPRVIIS